MGKGSSRSAVQIAYHWHRLLLSRCRDRPRRRAAKQRDELAPPHAEPPPPESVHRILSLPQESYGYWHHVPSPIWGASTMNTPPQFEVGRGSHSAMSAPVRFAPEAVVERTSMDGREVP